MKIKNFIRPLYPHGVMFHHFHSFNFPKTGQGSINSKQFEKIINYLIKNYEILKPKEWLNESTNHNLKPQQICLTFDDCLFSQYKIPLDILKKYKLKAFWFIYSSVFNGELDSFEIYRKFRVQYYKNFNFFFKDFIKTYKNLHLKNIIQSKNNISKYNKKIIQIKKSYPMYSHNDIVYRIIRDEVLEKEEFEIIMNQMIAKKNTTFKKISTNLWMKNKHLKVLNYQEHEIGLHAYNHPFALAKLSYREQYSQLHRNFNHINSCIKQKPFSIAYPNGSYNNDTIKILKKLKIKIGFCSNMKLLNKNNYSLFFPRLDHTQLLKII